MNPFVSRLNSNQWVLPVTGMCFVLGFMVAMAWVTESNRNSRMALLAPDQRVRVNMGEIDLVKYRELIATVARLQEENTKLQNTLAQEGKASTVLNETLQQIKNFAGLTELEGPGVLVTLRDKQGSEADASMPLQETAIHDYDLMRVVNELFAAGAEGISVNNIRIAIGSTFRCVGPTILVNDVRIASPVLVRAIGDPDTLFGGLTLPGGVLAEIRGADPSMVQIEKVSMMRLPAYVGNTTRRIAKVPKAKK